MASLLLDGCSFIGDGLSTKLIARPATFHVPPQVEAGKPFLIYADFNANCDDKAEVTTLIDEQSKSITIRLSQWLHEYQACPAAVFMMRTTKTLTLPNPGTYQVAPATFEEVQPPAATVQVLPAGQPAPEWTPAPLEQGRYPVPTGTLAGRVVDGTTGAGLEAVKVSVRDVVPVVEGYTDRDGRFELTKVPQGDQIVGVAKDGFALRGDRLVAKVRPNSSVTMDEIVLEPRSTLASPSPSPAAN